MKCPSCSYSFLKPVKLQASLPARKCTKCRGVLIDLLTYREWAENYTFQKAGNAPNLSEVEDTKNAKVCTKCSKIMLKFRIDGSTSNKVDVCTTCDDAWLDEGEWELLSSLEIQHKLNHVFTDPWQQNIIEGDSQKAHEQRFKEILGVEQYGKLLGVKEWINDHPNKDDLIRFILKI